MSFPQEKRQHLRIGLRLPIRYQITSTEEFGNTLTSNISLGGVRIFTDQFMPPDTKLNLEINFINLSKMINAFGNTVWSQRIPYTDRYEAGINFTEITQKDKEEFLECLNRSTS